MKIPTGDDVELDEESTVKVQIPKRLHLQLHTMKIIGDQTISEIVEEALREHLDVNRED